MPRRSENKLTMTALLRKALTKADSLLAIERATGIHRASLRRFRDGEQSLRLDMADKLAAYLGIRVLPRARSERARHVKR